MAMVMCWQFGSSQFHCNVELQFCCRWNQPPTRTMISFFVWVDRCFLAPSTRCTSAFHELLLRTTSSVPNDAGENMLHALPKSGSHQPNPFQTARFQSQNPAEPDSRRSMFKSVQCDPDRMRVNCDYVWRVVVSISKCFCVICGWGDELHQ